MREQPDFANQPVLVFSSSGRDQDVDAAYRLGASGYIVKPALPAELLQVMRRVKKYWLEMDGPPAGCAEWSSILVRQQTSNPK